MTVFMVDNLIIMEYVNMRAEFDRVQYTNCKGKSNAQTQTLLYINVRRIRPSLPSRQNLDSSLNMTCDHCSLVQRTC